MESESLSYSSMSYEELRRVPFPKEWNENAKELLRCLFEAKLRQVPNETAGRMTRTPTEQRQERELYDRNKEILSLRARVSDMRSVIESTQEDLDKMRDVQRATAMDRDSIHMSLSSSEYARNQQGRGLFIVSIIAFGFFVIWLIEVAK